MANRAKTPGKVTERTMDETRVIIGAGGGDRTHDPLITNPKQPHHPAPEPAPIKQCYGAKVRHDAPKTGAPGKVTGKDVSKYKPGDLPPVGYLQWHDWAQVQIRAGLRERRCPVCGLWRFPQEKYCIRRPHA